MMAGPGKRVAILTSTCLRKGSRMRASFRHYHDKSYELVESCLTHRLTIVGEFPGGAVLEHVLFNPVHIRLP